MAVHVFAEQQHELDRLGNIVWAREPAAGECLLQRKCVIARPIVAHAITLDHHFGGTFKNDAGPDVRSFEVHGNRHFIHCGSARFQIVKSLTNFCARALIADRMMKTLFEERDAQTLHVAIERLHVIADLSVDCARVMRIGTRYCGQKSGDILGARADRSAMIDRIRDWHAACHRH